MRDWVIEIPGRPTTTNDERRGNRHWTQTRELTRNAREATAWLALEAKIPHLRQIAIVVRPILRDRRTQDLVACQPTYKAAVDGLRDAGVIDDDDPTHVVQVTFDPPQLSAGRDALELTIYEIS